MADSVEDLQEIWETLDTCFDRPEKHIAEARDPIVKFRKYRAFDNGAVREFYSRFRGYGNSVRREEYSRVSKWRRR